MESLFGNRKHLLMQQKCKWWIIETALLPVLILGVPELVNRMEEVSLHFKKYQIISTQVGLSLNTSLLYSWYLGVYLMQAGNTAGKKGRLLARALGIIFFLIKKPSLFNVRHLCQMQKLHVEKHRVKKYHKLNFVLENSFS